LPVLFFSCIKEKRMKCIVRFILLSIVLSLMYQPVKLWAANGPVIPVKDTVTMVDLGAKSCIPCKMMAPILEELKIEYEGRAAVIFIDVWKDRSQGFRFGIQAIPTQIFYDKHGKEVYRHIGFMDKETIKKQLDMLLEGQ
jgi:thioredoxin 1